MIQETLRIIARANWISKVDVRVAFHRLRINAGNEWKTALTTRFGSYEWLVTSFGITGAPAAFQGWIKSVLGSLLRDTYAAYLDDIIKFSEGDLVDYWTKVNEVLAHLLNVGLKFDLNKFVFALKYTKYLGFNIRVDKGIEVESKKVEAIKS